jgi:hypothetical protein
MEPGCASTTPDGGAAPAIHLEWVNPRKSLSRPGLVYTSARGTPTTFHLRHTCVLMARPMGKGQTALFFAASADSFAVRALAQVYKTFSTRRYDIDSGMSAIFEGHSKVFDANGEELSGVLPDLEGWIVHALITLRGKWESGHHTGLRLEVAQVQLVQPLWDQSAPRHGDEKKYVKKRAQCPAQLKKKQSRGGAGGRRA